MRSRIFSRCDGRQDTDSRPARTLPDGPGVTELAAGLLTAGRPSRALLAASAMVTLLAIRARRRGRTVAAVAAVAFAGTAALSGLWDPGVNVSTWTLWANALVGGVAAVALRPAALGVDTPRAREALVLVLVAGAAAAAMVVRTTSITWPRWWLPAAPLARGRRCARDLVPATARRRRASGASRSRRCLTRRTRVRGCPDLPADPAREDAGSRRVHARTDAGRLPLHPRVRRGVGGRTGAAARRARPRPAGRDRPATAPLAAILAILPALPRPESPVRRRPASASTIRTRAPRARGGGGRSTPDSNTHRIPAHADSLREKVEFYRDAGFDFVSITGSQPDVPDPVAEAGGPSDARSRRRGNPLSFRGGDRVPARRVPRSRRAGPVPPHRQASA